MKDRFTNFPEEQLRGVLRLAQFLAGETKNDEANFFEMSADDSLEQAERSTRERVRRGGGRVLEDKTPADREARRIVRAYLKKRRITGTHTQTIIRPGDKE